MLIKYVNIGSKIKSATKKISSYPKILRNDEFSHWGWYYNKRKKEWCYPTPSHNPLIVLMTPPKKKDQTVHK